MMVRKILRYAAAAAGLVVALATCADEGEEEPAFDCGEAESADIYERRIKPLLEDDEPQSCNQCHLSGIDLGVFAKDTPCNTMACWAEQGLVDLETPEQSLVLSWLDRAEPESEGITADVLATERAGVLEWIQQSATCGLCAESDDPCGAGEAGEFGDCGVLDTNPESLDLDDPGDCSDKTLESLFLNEFFAYRGRCYPCHFDGFEEAVPEAPKWIGVGACETASLSTMRRVMNRGYIDVDDPAGSLWLLKPLEENVGGIEHGGGPKLYTLEEDAYVSMLHWATRYAECTKP
jgi:hypothetical protein